MGFYHFSNNNLSIRRACADAIGNYDIRIRITPLQTLVDNTRYRLTFSGKILGIDFSAGEGCVPPAGRSSDQHVALDDAKVTHNAPRH